MFTGIISHIGRVAGVTPVATGLRLEILNVFQSDTPKLGESIAVNGACLTVAAISPDRIHVDVIPETLQKTNLGQLKPASAVNLERSLRLGDRLDGHLVQGHIDGTGDVQSVTTIDGWRVRLKLPEPLMAFMTPKGSVCLDGVSLTLAHVDKAASCIEVALIPVTLEKTTLNAWQPGRRVNVEADMMVKAIVDRLRALGVG